MFEYPLDWYRRASIRVPSGIGSFKILWIAYGTPNPIKYEPPAFLGPVKGHVVITPTTEPRNGRPQVLDKAPGEIVSSARPIGVLTIDLSTHKFTSFTRIGRER
jgi:hypothetical protein